MARSLKCVLAVVVVVSTGELATAQTLAQAAPPARKVPTVNPALRADIELLMNITGSSAASAQMASAMSDAFLNSFRESQKSVSPRVIEIMRELLNTEFRTAFTGSEIKDGQVALYAKYFTHEEVKGLLAFYRSATGKKMLAAMPNLTREGAALGEQWARDNMQRILQTLETRLRSEGLLPATENLR